MAEPHFYYNGCETTDITTEEVHVAENAILNLAADVLIEILANEYKEEK